MIIVLALIALAAVLVTIAHAVNGKVPLWIGVLLVGFVVLVQLALMVWK